MRVRYVPERERLQQRKKLAEAEVEKVLGRLAQVQAALRQANEALAKATGKLADYEERHRTRIARLARSDAARDIELEARERIAQHHIRRLPNLHPGAADAPGTNTETSSPVAGERELRPSRVDGSRLAGLAGG